MQVEAIRRVVRLRESSQVLIDRVAEGRDNHDVLFAAEEVLRDAHLHVRQVELVEQTLRDHRFVLGNEARERKHYADRALREDRVLVEVAAVALGPQLLESHGRFEVLGDSEAQLAEQSCDEVDFFKVLPAAPLVATTDLSQIRQVEKAELRDQLGHHVHVERYVLEAQGPLATERHLEDVLVKLFEHTANSVLARELMHQGLI